MKLTRAYECPYPYKGGKLPRRPPKSVRRMRRNGPVVVWRPIEYLLQGI